MRQDARDLSALHTSLILRTSPLAPNCDVIVALAESSFALV